MGPMTGQHCSLSHFSMAWSIKLQTDLGQNNGRNILPPTKPPNIQVQWWYYISFQLLNPVTEASTCRINILSKSG
ncbi:27000_t:CDS:2 [Dentiscutata erythropus]|uniref:27000_t:CDS:1 n=1 Tax=Dentiscutata erythropus TaxID=1348616 RepID=A0A9N9CKJ3_9GLOM|nr:27000_t:CDS:2 [Dentiscutata erythropus]